jgi:hypothetical protein
VDKLALVHLPISLGVESHLQQAVLGIVSFAAARTDEIAAPARTLVVVILGDGKRGSATAGDEEHAQRWLGLRALLGLTPGFHDSSLSIRI